MDERDPRRRFNKAERNIAWLSQDGKSAISGKPLGSEFHADHRIPWSVGGKTDIANCQILTPEENLSKGARYHNRFAWQDEFIDAWNGHTEPNFFLCALPGAGKTKASIRAIRLWLDLGGVVVVLVPTIPILENWRAECWKSNISLNKEFFLFVKENYHGMILTYAALRSNVLAFQKLCADRAVLLICDEIHHASESEESRWGLDLRNGFAAAQRRLLLSGTPVRSDKETTSFLKIEDFVDDDGKASHRYKMDYVYDWPRALEDEVVCPITFHRIKMDNVHVSYSDGEKTFKNSDDEWLTYALDERRFLLSLLGAANEKLDALRIQDPTVGGLAVAKNIAHARILYDLLKVMGQQPDIIHTETDENSKDVIDAFRDGNKKWMVSVMQVSEGVNIPRLRVLAHLTNYTTELHFRQLVGRVVRRRDSDDAEKAQAHVFIPETRRLTVHADKIENLQELVFKKGRNGEPPAHGERGFTVGGSEPQFIGYIIHGVHYVGDRAAVIHQLMEKYKVTEQSAVLMINDSNFAQGLRAGETKDDLLHSSREMPPWIEEKLLRDTCKELTKTLVDIRQKNRGLGSSYNQNVFQQLAKEINREFMIDRVPQPDMSISQLKRKIERLNNAIAQEKR